MKYKEKSTTIIEAEQYKAGMEDGFSCIPYMSRCQWKDGNGYYKQCLKCKLDIPKKPFISKIPFIPNSKLIVDMSAIGINYIDSGDWIITNEKGEHYPCKPDIFEATYEPVEQFK